MRVKFSVFDKTGQEYLHGEARDIPTDIETVGAHAGDVGCGFRHGSIVVAVIGSADVGGARSYRFRVMAESSVYHNSSGRSFSWMDLDNRPEAK